MNRHFFVFLLWFNFSFFLFLLGEGVVQISFYFLFPPSSPFVLFLFHFSVQVNERLVDHSNKTPTGLFSTHHLASSRNPTFRPPFFFLSPFLSSTYTSALSLSLSTRVRTVCGWLPTSADAPAFHSFKTLSLSLSLTNNTNSLSSRSSRIWYITQSIIGHRQQLKEEFFYLKRKKFFPYCACAARVCECVCVCFVLFVRPSSA